LSFLNKQAAAAAGGSVAGRPLSGILAELPAVTEFLSSECYDDGSRRERSTLMVFRENGVVKVCLSDRDLGRTLWRAADGVETAIMELEQAIVDGTADWRVAAGSRSAKRVAAK
jgi:hypothetical protein